VEESTWLDVVLDHDQAEAFEDRVRSAVELVVSGENASISSLAVILSGHETVRSLNARYLEHDYETDVLAFDLSEGEDAIDGEVYVDIDTALEYAAEHSVDPSAEVARYAIHGTLHLTGHRDDTAAGKEEMSRLEEHYLKTR
jgi:probable rRNA maturation factor